MSATSMNISISNNAALRKHKGSYFALAETLEVKKDTGLKSVKFNKLSDRERREIRNEAMNAYRIRKVVVLLTAFASFAVLYYCFANI